jgi:hypothetical protein
VQHALLETRLYSMDLTVLNLAVPALSADLRPALSWPWLPRNRHRHHAA